MVRNARGEPDPAGSGCGILAPVPSAFLSAVLVLADIPAAPVLGVMTFAIVLTLAGHINRNPKVVALGIAVLMLATAAMILGAYISYTGDNGDPRPCNQAIPGGC